MSQHFLTKSKNKIVPLQKRLPQLALKNKISQDLLDHWGKCQAEINELLTEKVVSSDKIERIQNAVASMAGLVFDVTGLILYNDNNPKDTVQLFHKCRNCLNHQISTLKNNILHE